MNDQQLYVKLCDYIIFKIDQLIDEKKVKSWTDLAKKGNVYTNIHTRLINHQNITLKTFSQLIETVESNGITWEEFFREFKE